MASLAMGWLRWPPDQAMRTNVNAIMLAIEGDVERAEVMSGGRKSPTGPLDIRAFVREHNMARQRRMGD